MGLAPEGPLHVGLRADRARLSKALFVLLRVAHGWPGTAATTGGPRGARGRGTAPARVSIHCAGRRQFLSGHLRRSRAGASPSRPLAAAATAGVARRAP